MADLIRVLVVGNLPIISVGLSSILSPEVGIRVMGTAQNAPDAVRQAETIKADVIIVGMCHPEQRWLQTIANLVEYVPQAKVVALNISASQTSLAEAVRLGASNFIPEGSTALEMQEIIQRTASLAVHPMRA